MRPLSRILSGALVLVAASAFAGRPTIPVTADGFAARRLSVKMAPGGDAALVDAAIGATQVDAIPQIGWRTVELPAGVTLDRALAYYRSLGAVREVSRISLRKLDATPNDPMFGRQYGPQRIQAPQAWDFTFGRAAVVIAVIDTGLDLGHPEFVGKTVPGYDFSDNDSDPSESADSFHGTHCAGIAAASVNNNVGIAGIAGNSRVMPLKIFPNAFGDVSARAITFAADNGAKVISMSYGSPFADPVERDAIAYAVSKQALPFASAGNSNLNLSVVPRYPACHEGTTSVGSTDRGDAKSDFSNWGPLVQVAAPGTDILSTFPRNQGSYATISGTSMACPTVSGLAALAWAFAPSGTTAEQIRAAIVNHTDPIAGNWLMPGRGRINALRTLRALQIRTVVRVPLGTTGVFDGRSFPGATSTPPTTLDAVDGRGVTVNMARVTGLGQTGGYVVRAAMPARAGSTLMSSTLTVNGTVTTTGVLQVFALDQRTRRPVLLATTSNLAGFTLDLPTTSQYVAADGSVSLLLRGLVAERAGAPTTGGRLFLDRVMINGSYQQN